MLKKRVYWWYLKYIKEEFYIVVVFIVGDGEGLCIILKEVLIEISV